MSCLENRNSALCLHAQYLSKAAKFGPNLVAGMNENRTSIVRHNADAIRTQDDPRSQRAVLF